MDQEAGEAFRPWRGREVGGKDVLVDLSLGCFHVLCNVVFHHRLEWLLENVATSVETLGVLVPLYRLQLLHLPHVVVCLLLSVVIVCNLILTHRLLSLLLAL